MSANLGPWEDDGLPTDDQRKRDAMAREAYFDWLFFAELDRFCHRCDRLHHLCDCAEHDMALLDRWDDRTEAVEAGHPLTHRRADDGE